MPIQSTDSTSPINFTTANQTWTVSAGVSVTTTTNPVSMSYEYDVLVNHGNISGAGGYAGPYSSAAHCQLINAADGFISAGYGFSTDGASCSFTNLGTVVVESGGVDSNFDMRVVNAGLMSCGGVGVAVGGGSSVINSGQLYSAGYGVVINGAGLIENSGLIQGGGYAVVIFGTGQLDNSGVLLGSVAISNAAATIINSGQIHGNVSMSLLDDYFDGRGGTVSGSISAHDGADTIFGGSGDDTINGGLGADRLDGGNHSLGGADTFVFTDVKDSRPSGMDEIHKHWSADCSVDLSAIDGDAHAKGFQHLTFGGAVAAGATLATGVVDYIKQNGETYVVIDTSGDGQADFKLHIHGTFNLSADEFVL